jgi:DNA-binding Lrp family transcriptional regulator
MSRVFSQRELRVLARAVNDAESPASDIGKDVKLREHTVRYILSNLKRRGEIYTRVPFLNLHVIGLSDFAVFFSLAPMKEGARVQALKALKLRPEVTWMASLVGEFQYCAVISVKNPLEAPQILDELAEKHGVLLTASIVSLRRRHINFGRRHLSPGTITRPLTSGGTQPQYILKEVDDKILRVMSRGTYDSIRDVALKIGEPAATVSRRVRELESRGVIAGYVYRLNLAGAGFSIYRLLLVVTGDLTPVRKAIMRYAEGESRITHYFECFGSWNYELGLEVQSSRDLAQIRDSLSEAVLKAGAQQISVKTVQILESLKFNPFPA